VKDTTTNERGEFVLVGVGSGPRFLLADHEQRGRSSSIALPATTESAMNVQLVVLSLGTLDGKVTRGGQPAARVVITAVSATAEKSMFSVITGGDGSYRFDRLAPDRYIVSVMEGYDPTQGLGFHSRSVVVASERATTADFAIDPGNHVVIVKPVAQKPVRFAFVEAVEGRHAPKLARDLERAANSRDGRMSFAMAIAGKPARVEKLGAGEYTVCAIPYPDEVAPEAAEDYMLREGDNLPVFCKPVVLRGAGGEQTIEIEVKLPPFVPAPKDDTDA
jgi:hypothetical protein